MSDQAARARAWGVFARKALALPFVVGINHFSWVDEPKGGRGASATCQPTGPCGGEASVASFLAAAVTDIYLCNACSYQETLRRNGRG